MTSHPFLSAAWIDAVADIRHSVPAPEQLPAVIINLVVNEVPTDVDDSGSVAANLDTGDGVPQLTLGHHDDPDVVVTTDYITARALLADVDPAAVMSAFLAGKVVIQGEMLKLMTLQGALAADPNAGTVAARIRSLTA